MTHSDVTVTGTSLPGIAGQTGALLDRFLGELGEVTPLAVWASAGRSTRSYGRTPDTG